MSIAAERSTFEMPRKSDLIIARIEIGFEVTHTIRGANSDSSHEVRRMKFVARSQSQMAKRALLSFAFWRKHKTSLRRKTKAGWKVWDNLAGRALAITNH